MTSSKPDLAGMIAIGLTVLLAPNLDALLREILNSPDRPSAVIGDTSTPDDRRPGGICRVIRPGVWFCVPDEPVPVD